MSQLVLSLRVKRTCRVVDTALVPVLLDGVRRDRFVSGDRMCVEAVVVTQQQIRHFRGDRRSPPRGSVALPIRLIVVPTL